MTKPVIVIGCGGHAAVLIDTLQLLGRDIIGVVDPVRARGEVVAGSIVVLGDDEIVLSYAADDIELVNGIGSLPKQSLRKKLFERFDSLGYVFTTVVHPSAIMSPSVNLSAGVQIMAGVVLQANTTIGVNSIINTRVGIDHDCVIGKHNHIAPGATLCGDVTIDDYVHVGAGATIIQGITIGLNAVVGAGAVITKNMLMKSVAYSARSFIKDTKGNVQ